MNFENVLSGVSYVKGPVFYSYIYMLSLDKFLEVESTEMGGGGALIFVVYGYRCSVGNTTEVLEMDSGSAELANVTELYT